jgi:hypothetical protein
MDEVHKPSDSDCYTPSSEQSRISDVYAIFMAVFMILNSKTENEMVLEYWTIPKFDNTYV